jgi:hypothetical protein
MPNSPQNNPYAPDAALNSINIKSFGAVSLHNASDAFNYAVALITDSRRNPNEAGTIYCPPHNYIFRTSCTIPEGVDLYLEHGATLTVASGKTLTLNGGYNGRGVFAGDGTVVLTNIEKIDARDFGVKMNDDDNDYSGELNKALVGANAVTSGVSKGARVVLPAGVVYVDSPLTGQDQVALCGSGAFVWNTPYPHASVIVGTYQNNKLIDVTNCDNMTIENLGFYGGQTVAGGSTDHHAIFGTGVTNLVVRHCSITRFGGSAIRATGFGKWIEYVQATGCLMDYGDLAAQTGVLHVEGTENNVYECNFNGPAFDDDTHSAYGSGYAAGIYTNGSPNTWFKAVGAYAQIGIVVGTSVTTSPGDFSYCRGEFVQGHGWDIRGGNNAYRHCTAFNVNRDTSTPTYSGFYTVRVAPGFVNKNNFTDCIVDGSDATYKPIYGFTDQNNGAGNLFINVNHYNAGCRAPAAVTSTFNPTFGVCIPIIDGQNRAQAGSLNTTPSPDELTFNGEDGKIWRAAIASGADTKILAEKLLPGQTYTLYLVQHATPGTVTLGAVFAKTATFTSPPASAQVTGQFYSDGTSLYQTAPWTEM